MPALPRCAEGTPHEHALGKDRRGEQDLLQEPKPVGNFIQREIGIFPRVDLGSLLPALEAEGMPVSHPQQWEHPSARTPLRPSPHVSTEQQAWRLKPALKRETQCKQEKNLHHPALGGASLLQAALESQDLSNSGLSQRIGSTRKSGDNVRGDVRAGRDGLWWRCFGASLLDHLIK